MGPSGGGAPSPRDRIKTALTGAESRLKNDAALIDDESEQSFLKELSLLQAEYGGGSGITGGKDANAFYERTGQKARGIGNPLADAAEKFSTEVESAFKGEGVYGEKLKFEQMVKALRDRPGARQTRGSMLSGGTPTMLTGGL